MTALPRRGDAGFPLLKDKPSSWKEDSFRRFYDLPLAFRFRYMKELMKQALLSP